MIAASAPLAGIRVVDCSAVVSGPLATTILADQGADVIKVEPLGVGDILRHVGSHRGGMSGMFHVVNRGKRSLALNLADARGRAILEHLTATARAMGLNRLSLETGNSPLFAAANRLYVADGFDRCGSFGGYPNTAFTHFYTREN